MKKKLFIGTNDKNVADQLLSQGNQLYAIDSNGTWLFANNPKLQFSEDVKGKIIYTDIMNM